MGNEISSVNTKSVIPTTINNLERKIDIDIVIIETNMALMEQQATLQIVLTCGEGNVVGIIQKFLQFNYKRQILNFLKEILRVISADADFLHTAKDCPSLYQPHVAGILYAGKKFNYSELIQLRCVFRKQFKNLSSFEGNGINITNITNKLFINSLSVFKRL